MRGEEIAGEFVIACSNSPEVIDQARNYRSNPMDRPVITNIETYKAIADEAHAHMVAAMEAGRRPEPDGSPGWIITFDPDQTSFK